MQKVIVPGESPSIVSRRTMLQTSAATAAATLLGGLKMSQAIAPSAVREGVKNGRINQSVCGWCFMEGASPWPWSLEEVCQRVKALGGKSVELVGPKEWPTLRSHGLQCAIAIIDVPGLFVRGFNNPRYHAEVIAATKERIDECTDSKCICNQVIAFTGYKWQNAEDPESGEISREEGAKHCIEGLKRVAGHAENKKVTVSLEMLNTRDDTHPMKGHPGYQGDDLDWVTSIIKAVGSPRVKLLFDIYHVQVMHGDVIRRLGEGGELTSHVHVAGNPGRGELDGTQEINFPPIMRKLIEIGYTGFVGQEFIPTRDPMKGLKEAVELCDV